MTVNIIICSYCAVLNNTSQRNDTEKIMIVIILMTEKIKIITHRFSCVYHTGLIMQIRFYVHLRTLTDGINKMCVSC